MTKYKISIIVPCYNVEKYLARCLNSLINQTLRDIEIICVNDGSTDNSFGILKQYAQTDNRIKIINQNNQGLSVARNSGLKIVQGEYFGFVDSDDWVDLDYFEKLYNRAIECDADIAFADFIRTNCRTAKIRLKLIENKIYVTNDEKFQGTQFYKESCVWNKIYRTDKFKDLRFEKGVYYEDGRYSIQALNMANKAVSVTGSYLYYFANPKSIVKTPNRKKNIDRYETNKFILNYIKHQMPLYNTHVEYEIFAKKIWLIKLFSIVESLTCKKYYIYLLFLKVLIFKQTV